MPWLSIEVIRGEGCGLIGLLARIHRRKLGKIQHISIFVWEAAFQPRSAELSGVEADSSPDCRTKIGSLNQGLVHRSCEG